jgi:hypothetical protein
VNYRLRFARYLAERRRVQQELMTLEAEGLGGSMNAELLRLNVALHSFWVDVLVAYYRGVKRILDWLVKP